MRVTKPRSPVETNPIEPVWPSAVTLSVIAAAGGLPAPRLWNGPTTQSEIGPLTVLDPDRTERQAEVEIAAVDLCGPLNVCFSSPVASVLALLPASGERDDRERGSRNRPHRAHPPAENVHFLCSSDD